jgi:hypothetical protein
MNRLFKVTGFAACLAAMVVMLGGHWLALQSVAWGCMIADFARQGPLDAAISKTFSGKYPCSLCLKVRKGWHEDQQRGARMPWVKTEKMPEVLWELRCATAPAAATGAQLEQRLVSALYSDFIDAPPVPPPRVLLSTL